MPAPIASPCPASTVSPISAEDSAITEPTDRSMPRVPIASDWPSAIRIRGAASNNSERITVGLRKPGVTSRSNATRATNAT